MEIPCAHQDAPAIVLNVRPFVEVERNRVGVLNADRPLRRSSLRMHNAPKAPSTWNQRPSVLQREASAARSSIAPLLTGPGAPDHTKRIQAGGAIPRNLYLKLGRIDAEVGIDFDFA